MIINKDFASGESLGKRQRQEDFCSFILLDEQTSFSNGVLAVIADGMGGHAAGDEASKIAVRTFSDFFLNNKSDLLTLFTHSLNEANNKIKILSDNVGICGCTLIAALIFDNYLKWISVGDSLLYVYRNGELKKQNADHSLYPILIEQYNRGEISIEEVNQNKNVLCSAVDGNKLELVDINVEGINLEENDVILLATDGIETLEENEIRQALEDYSDITDAKGMSDVLLNMVSNKGIQHQDNTTVMVIKI
ncbi:MAG: serine/threonine-protein phosphatase [Verrucomicrobiaceae bacterium]|nr:serine/threonine-protein phosphatase [Verrucomicrobiaceae bacterium]